MAELKQVFSVAQPRQKVWAAFQDIEKVAGCLPGASLTEPPAGDTVKGQMIVKLGPVKANFAGQAEIHNDETSYTGTITGAGVDRNQGSRAKGDVRYVLEETDGGKSTRVVVSVDYTLSGALAQFSRGGIVEAVAGKLTEDFAANLEAELAEGEQMDRVADAAGSTSDAPRSAPTQARRGASELNAFGLLGAVIKGWFKNLFGRKLPSPRGVGPREA